MNPEAISVISLEEEVYDEEEERNAKHHSKSVLKDFLKAICISHFGIIAISVIFATPWTSIPRTDSIIYQSHWMEVNLPSATIALLVVGSRFLQLKTWLNEDKFMSIWIYLKMYLMDLFLWNLLTSLSYVIWSGYYKFNHPLPQLGLLVIPMWILFMIGLGFILPSHIFEKDHFRKRWKVYMLYQLWQFMIFILREILAFLFTNAPDWFQFWIPFLVAGCRELDTYIRSKLVNRITIVEGEETIALNEIILSSEWSIFIAIRLVGEEIATICCAVAIDFVLHLKMTLQIIKDKNKVSNTESQIVNTKRRNLTTLMIAELIEGFTPIIYLTCIAMAYYGPNDHLFSNIGNSYWSEEINDIVPVFLTMAILFSFDTLSFLITVFCVWKFSKVNMLQEFCRMIGQYWYFMAVNLAQLVVNYISAIDVNFGMDVTHSYQWVTSEGWMNLVNQSIHLTNEEKAEIIADETFL